MPEGKLMVLLLWIYTSPLTMISKTKYLGVKAGIKTGVQPNE